LRRRRKTMNPNLFSKLSACEKEGCQIYLGTIYQNGENIPNGHKIYQSAIRPENGPNGHKIYQYLPSQKTLQNLPKLGFLV
jgi:hypothetical protein